MKKTIIYSILLVSIVYLSSCSRTLTPYEAANGSHRKCMRIK